MKNKFLKKTILNIFSQKDIKFLYFPLFILTLYIAMIIFNIHSSSIGMYHNFFYGSINDKNLIYGQPRAIRSDEWIVVTPKNISAKLSNLSPISEATGLEENYVIQGMPVRHWTNLFHPQNWAYFILSLNKSFVYQWWFGPILMILSSYILILILTKKLFASIITPLIFFFTPFNQWWSYSLSYYIGYGNVIIILFYLFIRSKNLIAKISYAIGIAYFSLCYIFLQYPPFQISFGWIIVILILSILLENRKKLKRIKYIEIGVLLTFTIILIGAILFQFYKEVHDILMIIFNTVYPGKRISEGGNYPLLHFLNGFYNIQLLDNIKGSASFGNQSEASNFFMVSFFAIPTYLFTSIKKILNKEKINWFFGLSLIYFIILIYYIFIDSNHNFILNKILLFNFVPAKRALIGIGVANYLLAIFFLFKLKFKKDTNYKIIVFINSFFSFFINLYIGFYLKNYYPKFIQNNYRILLISIIAGLLVYFLLMQYKKLFLSLLLLFSIISTYRVNPIYKTLDPLINTPIAKKIQKIENTDKSDHRWVNYTSNYFRNYPQANGAKSLTGVYYYPQFNLMKILDPSHKYINVWNRYAHVAYSYNPKKNEEFILHQADAYSINMHPCDNRLKKLKVKYYIFNKNVNYQCLKLKQHINNIFIYQRIK